MTICFLFELLVIHQEYVAIFDIIWISQINWKENFPKIFHYAKAALKPRSNTCRSLTIAVIIHRYCLFRGWCFLPGDVLSDMELSYRGTWWPQWQNEFYNQVTSESCILSLAMLSPWLCQMNTCPFRIHCTFKYLNLHRAGGRFRFPGTMGLVREVSTSINHRSAALGSLSVE